MAQNRRQTIDNVYRSRQRRTKVEVKTTTTMVTKKQKQQSTVLDMKEFDREKEMLI